MSASPRAWTRRAGLFAAVLLGLAGCAAQPSAPSRPGTAAPFGAPGQGQVARAGLLLPLSGAQAPLGQTLMNAAVMGMFDEAPTGVEFVPRDTGGTAGGAAAAARAAIGDGARVLVGPLTSAEAAAVAPVAQAAQVPLLAFTNDAQRAGPGVWVMGMTPAQQVRRVVASAARDGAQRFVLAAPNNDFGRALAAATRGAAADLGVTAAVSLHPVGADMGSAAAAARAAAPQADAVLLGEGGDRATRFALAWAEGMDPLQRPRLLGTALWLNDPSLRVEGPLAGAWFPGPDPTSRARFEQRFRDAFGDAPPRIAASAYDAGALAARALRARAPLDSLTASRSFQGADGPVRLLPGGQTARGLAIYALSPGGEAVAVEPATEPAGTGF
ncbi:penicillin-binding protein activator [Falsiroseomonas sp. HW251]|uniref:penicillin-binding protein activator n=1 Tax=Falsiroseomonas sp. HW251 TaxID=3390998 RepID=UPI003D317F5D